MRSTTLYTSTEAVDTVRTEAKRKSFCKMTLYKWEREGKVRPTAKTAFGTRLYTRADITNIVRLARKMTNQGRKRT